MLVSLQLSLSFVQRCVCVSMAIQLWLAAGVAMSTGSWHGGPIRTHICSKHECLQLITTCSLNVRLSQQSIKPVKSQGPAPKSSQRGHTPHDTCVCVCVCVCVSCSGRWDEKRQNLATTRTKKTHTQSLGVYQCQLSKNAGLPTLEYRQKHRESQTKHGGS